MGYSLAAEVKLYPITSCVHNMPYTDDAAQCAPDIRRQSARAT